MDGNDARTKLEKRADLITFHVVPCNGCIRCCVNDCIRIFPHEDATQWRTVPHLFFKGAVMLERKRNGDCFYLDRNAGCTIQDNKPQMCREMDCRRIANNITYTRARQIDKTNAGFLNVWRKGKELLRVTQL